MSDRRTSSAAPAWAGGLAGLLSAAAGVAVGTAAAALLTGVPTPIDSVGNRAVDYAPPFLKDFAVRTFGLNDKPVLIGGVVVTLAIIAVVAGVLALKRPRLGVGIVAGLGVIAVAAALIDRTATANRVVALIPTVLTLVVAVGLLLFLLGRLNHVTETTPSSAFDRRGFLIGAFGIAVLAAIGGGISRAFGGAAAKESRAAVTLPAPTTPAPALDPDVMADVKGVSRFITPNRDFYRIDTALTVPDVPTEGYQLRISGMVDKPLTFSYQDLLDLPLEEHRITLTCVSNEVGGPYVGNAAWLGIPIRTVLEQAGVQSGADAIKSTSADSWTTGTPLGVVTDPDVNALIAVGMNGQPLPLEHGFPVRLVVPGLYGFVSATKWLTDIEVTKFSDFTAYWTSRGYTAEAPIKFSSRIDVPRAFEALPRDSVRVGGVAWAQAVGIERVEVKIDDGPWNDADLAAQDNIETWRQWSWQWQDATPGTHKITVRATNADGETQTSDRAAIRPNGTTGWHNVQFRVE